MLVFFSKSLIRSFLGKTQAIRSENRRANSQPWSHRGVNNWPNVRFNLKFYKYYFSVMPKYEIDTVSHKLFKESFFTFLKKRSRKSRKYENMKHWQFELVWLRGVHPTAESKCTPRSQSAHRGVKVHTAESNCTMRNQNRNLGSLWLLLMGQSGKFLLGVNNSIMQEKIWRKNFGLAMT